MRTLSRDRRKTSMVRGDPGEFSKGLLMHVGGGRTPQATREKPRAAKACGRPSLKAGHFLEPKADSEVRAGG